MIGYSSADVLFDYLFGDLFFDGADVWAASLSGGCLTWHSDISKHAELCQSASVEAEERDRAVINRLTAEPWPLKVARLFPVWLATQVHTHTHSTLIHKHIQERMQKQSNARLPLHRLLRDNILCIYWPLKSFEYVSLSFTGVIRCSGFH